MYLFTQGHVTEEDCDSREVVMTKERPKGIRPLQDSVVTCVPQQP